MASYLELQELVAELVVCGKIRKEQQRRDIERVYRQLKEQGAWGRPRAKNESKCLFVFECSLQVWGSTFWPTRLEARQAARDAELVAELRGTRLWADYQRVRRLNFGRVLPLTFYCDFVGSRAYAAQVPPIRAYEWDELYLAAKKYRCDGASAAVARQLMQTEARFRCLEQAMFAARLTPEELDRFVQLEANRLAFELHGKGLFSMAFARKYERVFRRCSEVEAKIWRRMRKLTLNPLWEKLPPCIAIRLYEGVPPQQVGDRVYGDWSRNYSVALTRSEAHQWLLAMAELESEHEQLQFSTGQYFARQLGISADDCSRFRFASRNLLVWYARKQANPVMAKARVVYGPGGQQRRFCFKDILDEISEADLRVPVPVHPDDPGRLCLNRAPEEVFEAAARRRYEQYLQRFATNQELPQLAGVIDPTGAITPISDTVGLFDEGAKLNHCVGGYAEACLTKRSFIFSVNTSVGRSTVEVCPIGSLDPDAELGGAVGSKIADFNVSGYRLVQHYGYGNTTPVEENRAAVAAWCQGNGIELPDWAVVGEEQEAA